MSITAEGHKVMDVLDVILHVEQEGLSLADEDVIEAIGEHRSTLRNLQGSWGRLIHHLETEGLI